MAVSDCFVFRHQDTPPGVHVTQQGDVVCWCHNTKSNPTDDHRCVSLKKSNISSISNHWASIPACSAVPPIYIQSKKTYCHISFERLKWQPSDSHKMSVALFTPTPYINKWQMSLCNNSSHNKSY